MRRILTAALLTALATAAVAAPADPRPAASPPAEAKEESAAATLDKLYDRLARTPHPDEAAGILAAIGQMRLQSGSDAADLLMARAMKARASAEIELSLNLCDAVVDLYPDWVQGWSERATARLQSGNLNGAMGDLAETLKREPRDIGALAELGSILLDSGDPQASLRAYERALALAPAYEPLKEARARAQNALWSRTP